MPLPAVDQSAAPQLALRVVLSRAAGEPGAVEHEGKDAVLSRYGQAAGITLHNALDPGNMAHLESLNNDRLPVHCTTVAPI